MELVIGVVVVMCLMAAIWRIASRRHTLPCPAYLRWMVELDNPFTKISRAATIVASLGITKGMRVLDAGCGPGRLTLPLAQAVGDSGEVWALDGQQGMLDHVAEKAFASGRRNITLVLRELGKSGDGKNALPHEYFDRIAMVTVLGEIPAVDTSQYNALVELYSSMRQGGVMSITEIVFDPHFMSQARVRSLAEEAGFRYMRTEGRSLAYSMFFTK